MNNWLHKSHREVFHELWHREFADSVRHTWRNLTWIGRILVMPFCLVGGFVCAVFTSLSFLVFKIIFR